MFRDERYPGNAQLQDVVGRATQEAKAEEQFLGYVQDERYDAVPWMAKSGDVQDERQIFAPCKIRISHIHVGRQDFVPDNPSPTNHFLKASHV